MKCWGLFVFNSDIIHTPSSFPSQSARCGGFQGMRNAVQPSPLPNSRTFPSSTRSAVPISSHTPPHPPRQALAATGLLSVSDLPVLGIWINGAARCVLCVCCVTEPVFLRPPTLGCARASFWLSSAPSGRWAVLSCHLWMGIRALPCFGQ